MTIDTSIETLRVELPRSTALALIARVAGLSTAQAASLADWPPTLIANALAALNTSKVVRDALSTYLQTPRDPRGNK